MNENHSIVRTIHYNSITTKVVCPQCKARLFDINSVNWSYKAVSLLSDRDKTEVDIAEKCPKCKLLVGVSLKNRQN